MKLSDIFNYPLSLLGFKLVRLSKLKELQKTAVQANNISDIEKDELFIGIYSSVREYTMVGIERSYALYKAVQYVVGNSIPGDFVECGVWRGGSCMLIAHTLKLYNITDRKIWLYDTFAGMVKPGDQDGNVEKEMWENYRVSDTKNNWCLGELDEVKTNLLKTGYPSENFIIVKGKVEETIPAEVPGHIALLRLDTDWYESTKHELEFLYPLINPKGILLIDDYGAWQGARKATDDYFKENGKVYMSRIDYTGRLIIKV